MTSAGRLTAGGVAVVCLLTAIYLGLQARDAATLRDANRLGLQGRYEQALREAQRVSRPPQRDRAALVQAYALRALGRPAAASAAFSAASQRDPGNWVIHRDWALVLSSLGRPAQARRELRRAVRLNPRMLAPAGLPRAAVGSGAG